MLWSGEQVWSRGSTTASSEVETCSGVPVPRARRGLARGGVKPSSEAETSWCSAWPSSEAEIRPRGTAAGCLMGRYGFLGRGPFSVLVRDRAECVLWFVGLFVRFFIIFRKRCFPSLLRDPYVCPRQLECEILELKVVSAIKPYKGFGDVDTQLKS
jgi:hypothetical protein